jgi:hypothetical protein
MKHNIEIEALEILYPNGFGLHEGQLFVNGEKVDNTEKDKKITELQAEYDAQEYARSRATAYDSVGDQLDQLMKDMRDGTTTHQTACEAVKAKFPKP